MTRKREDGFTIVELMIATAVFSVVLLVISAAIVQIGRLYYKGITGARTQEVARSVLTDIADTVQFGNGQITSRLQNAGDDRFGSICVATQHYSYALGKQIANGQHGLVLKDVPSGCSSEPVQNLSGAVSGQELLGDKMRLANFSVVPRDLYKVTLQNVGGNPWGLVGAIRAATGMDVAQTWLLVQAAQSTPTVIAQNLSQSDAQSLINNLGAQGATAIMSPSTGMYKITVRVVYGDDDLLCSPNLEGLGVAGAACSSTQSMDANDITRARDLTCKGIRSGTQFCAVSELSTIVERRLVP